MCVYVKPIQDCKRGQSEPTDVEFQASTFFYSQRKTITCKFLDLFRLILQTFLLD